MYKYTCGYRYEVSMKSLKNTPGKRTLEVHNKMGTQIIWEIFLCGSPIKIKGISQQSPYLKKII